MSMGARYLSVCRPSTHAPPPQTEADKEQVAALYKQFGKWHGISSLVNLVRCVGLRVRGSGLRSEGLWSGAVDRRFCNLTIL